MDILTPLGDIISFCYNFLTDTEFTMSGFTFSLWDVLVVSFIVSFIGMVIGVMLGGTDFGRDTGDD